VLRLDARDEVLTATPACPVFHRATYDVDASDTMTAAVIIPTDEARRGRGRSPQLSQQRLRRPLRRQPPKEGCASSAIPEFFGCIFGQTMRLATWAMSVASMTSSEFSRQSFVGCHFFGQALSVA